MSDIDTAAIRAWALADSWELSIGDVVELCDALDAARAERDIYRDAVVVYEYRPDPSTKVRAEAAEARIAYLEGYAAATVKEHRDAMDRINAALVRDHCVSCVHEALTGDPE